MCEIRSWFNYQGRGIQAPGAKHYHSFQPQAAHPCVSAALRRTRRLWTAKVAKPEKCSVGYWGAQKAATMANRPCDQCTSTVRFVLSLFVLACGQNICILLKQVVVLDSPLPARADYGQMGGGRSGCGLGVLWYTAFSTDSSGHSRR